MLDKHGFSKSPWNGKLFNKGDLKYILLDLLNEKPRHGYEIIQVLEKRSHGFYKPSAGTIYPTLQMLKKLCYVTADTRDGKNIFTISPEGVEFLLKQRDLTEAIKVNIKSQWDIDNYQEIDKIIKELARLRILFGYGFRHLDHERMQRILKIVRRAYEDIDEIFNEKNGNI